MGDQSFSLLNPVIFLQTILTQSVRNTDALIKEEIKSQADYIEQIGLSAGSCFESMYRQEYSIESALDQEQYTDLIIALKNRIGGSFSRSSGGPGYVRVVNSVCPLGDCVKEAPDLCVMTSSVFGGIAARNFGYARVVLDKSIGARDGECEVTIYLDENLAPKDRGDEYRSKEGIVEGRYTSKDLYSRIQEQMCKVWCESGSKNYNGSKNLPNIVAESDAMRSALETVDVVAPTKATALISGETGVGKELIARAIHALSDRWSQKFVAVNCGAIPESLIESALFGHEKGAFTGAYEVRHGFFERGEKGTLFLDEIDSLPLPAQVRLLRVLQEEEFERVGGKQTMRADVRVITACNADLARMAEEGGFRTDLYYRLNVVPIHIPPLRERAADIFPLAETILEKLSVKYRKKAPKISERAALAISAYHWPGNVRELENVLERTFLFTKGDVIDEIEVNPSNGKSGGSGFNLPEIDLRKAKKEAADRVETAILEQALKHFNGNIRAVAKLLNITPRAVHLKLSEHKIEPVFYRRKNVVKEPQ